MSRILICIRCGGNRGLNYFSTFYPPSFRRCPYIFDHTWAVTLLERAMKSLEDSYENGNAPMFNELKPFLSRVGKMEDYVLAARKLHMSVGAVMVAIHRLRRRYRDAVRREVAYTVDSPAGIDAEMRYLIQIIQGGKQVEATANSPA
jgi:hypothetical protein